MREFKTAYPVWRNIMQYSGAKDAFMLGQVNKLLAEYSDSIFGLVDIHDPKNSIDAKFHPVLKRFLKWYEKTELNYFPVAFHRYPSVGQLILSILRGLNDANDTHTILYFNIPPQLKVQSFALLRAMRKEENFLHAISNSIVRIKQNPEDPSFLLSKTDLMRCLVVMIHIVLSVTLLCYAASFLFSNDNLSLILTGLASIPVLSLEFMSQARIDRAKKVFFDVLCNMITAPKLAGEYYFSKPRVGVRIAENMASFFEACSRNDLERARRLQTANLSSGSHSNNIKI